MKKKKKTKRITTKEYAKCVCFKVATEEKHFKLQTYSQTEQ